MLRLDVLDETKGDPTPIGTCEIDGSVIFQNENLSEGKYIYDKWYDLTLNGRRAGMIYLEMTFYPSAPVLPPKLYESMESGQFRTSNSSHKTLPPPPPEHPLKHQQPNAMDDVFVSGEEKRSFFKTFNSLQSNQQPTPLNSSGSSAGSQADDVFVNGDEPPENLKQKYFLKFNKLKNKFQTKEPINHLWNGEERDRSERAAHINPIDTKEFDNLEDLERDLGVRTDPRANGPSNGPGARTSGPGARTSGPSRANERNDQYDRVFGGNDRYERFCDEQPPSPPPHSAPPSAPVSDYAPSDYPNPFPSLVTEHKKSPLRKPPPESPTAKPIQRTKPNTTSVPFSADSIGLDTDDLPTKVYFMDKPVKSLSYSSLPNEPEPVNTNEIDPRYYAPTPGEHFKQSRAAQLERSRDLDLRTKETGYLGNGQWDNKNFSPSIFDRMGKNSTPKVNDENLGFENKPHVPPKIPQGLSEQEYFVLEREKYLQDINGRRM